MFSQNGAPLSQNGMPLPVSQNGLPLPPPNPIAGLLDQNAAAFDQNAAAGRDQNSGLPLPSQNHLVPHPGAGNGMLPAERAHSGNFIASVIAHLLGAHQGGLLGQMVAGYHPGPAGGLWNYGPHPAAGGLPTHVPAPQLPAGAYTGAYAALGLRGSDPSAAAHLWESRHPYAMSHGNVPHWVTQALLAAIHGHQAAAAPAPPQPTNQPI